MTAAAAGMAWAVRGRSSTVFGPSVWRGEPGRKAIALTFDDGPGPATVQILEILARYEARGDILSMRRECGARAGAEPARYAAGRPRNRQPFILRTRISLSHVPRLSRMSFAARRKRFLRRRPNSPVLMRAPYGVRWFGFREMQRRLGLQGVMWSVIGLDWKLPARGDCGRVMAQVRDGAIICLHDGRGTLENPDASADGGSCSPDCAGAARRGISF